MFTTDLVNLYNRNIFKTSLYIYIFQDEKCRLMRNLSLSMPLTVLKSSLDCSIDRPIQYLRTNPFSKNYYIIFLFKGSLLLKPELHENLPEMAASPKFRKPLLTHIAYYFKDNKMPRTACLLVCLFVSNKRQNGWTGLAQMLTPASQGRFMKINSQKLYIFHTILKINEKKNCESGNFAMLYRRENAGRLYNN